LTYICWFEHTNSFLIPFFFERFWHSSKLL